MPYPIPVPSVPTSAQRWRRDFPGELDQARAARRFTAALLTGCPELDDVLLAVDELVVNALRHTKSGQTGGTFTVEITRWDGAVAVSVTDEGAPSEPTVADAEDDAESGRGVRTVSLMAAGWGWFGNDRSRTVTALFAASLGEAA
ncbi:ATP-binding protein [Actinomadura darangshiensis]|uniref:ATP-binding protein n=1 Tax=Actinomadura darangshiensis TaxID=705336 RepID=A0A4R5AUI3_9ACTN|nr:ATP-binding protein [Actinomadura darangshiensis]TDD74232.1 ATP-binding protein [Actinomadura darangshiensis]